MKKLYKFYWDCGRQGSLGGVFIADDEEIKKNLGKRLYFSEPFGKHSEVDGTLDEGNLTILTDDQDFIKKFEELKCSNGRNPLNYIRDEEENT